MENILAVVFSVESEGYQAITTLRQKALTENYAILQMSLVKRQGAALSVCDSYSSNIHTADDTARGGLVGGLLGILGGPLGVLFMGSTGALAGSIIDSVDAVKDATLIETVADKLQDNEVALIILAEEASEAALDAILSDYKSEIVRFDAAVVAEEVEEAERVQREMERKARQELRSTRIADRKQNIEDKRAKLKADFEAFKAKFKK